MIKAGYLCDIRGVKIQTDTDLGGVRTRLGDFVTGDLSEAIDTQERNQLIAETYLKHAEDRKAVVFCVDVQHAKNVAEAMKSSGVRCKAVYGEMPDDERRAALTAFNDGGLRVLTNCSLLTEGWDSPDLGAVLMARPTKSRVLYIQCVGRGLRTSPGKKDCLLLDFADVAERHDICAFGTLAGDDTLKPREGQSLLEAVEEKTQERRGGRAPEHTAVAFSLFDRSEFVWVKSGRNYRLSINNEKIIVCSPTKEGWNICLLEADGAMLPLNKTPLPLGYAQGTAEDYARQHAHPVVIEKNAAWRREVATERQLELLIQKGIPYSQNITKGEAQQLISAVFNEPLTEKQLRMIQRNGLHPNPAILTKREARELISRYCEKRSA